MPKRFLIPLAATAAISLTAVGLIVWIAADPQYWFPGAYASKGEQDDVGLRGPQGGGRSTRTGRNDDARRTSWSLAVGPVARQGAAHPQSFTRTAG
jgi:hypothetical protein